MRIRPPFVLTVSVASACSGTGAVSPADGGENDAATPDATVADDAGACTYPRDFTECPAPNTTCCGSATRNCTYHGQPDVASCVNDHWCLGLDTQNPPGISDTSCPDRPQFGAPCDPGRYQRCLYACPDGGTGAMVCSGGAWCGRAGVTITGEVVAPASACTLAFEQADSGVCRPPGAKRTIASVADFVALLARQWILCEKTGIAANHVLGEAGLEVRTDGSWSLLVREGVGWGPTTAAGAYGTIEVIPNQPDVYQVNFHIAGSSDSYGPWLLSITDGPVGLVGDEMGIFDTRYVPLTPDLPDGGH